MVCGYQVPDFTEFTIKSSKGKIRNILTLSTSKLLKY